MRNSYRGLVLMAALALMLTITTGCASTQKRKVTVIEEQHEGPVVEEQPGTMIVE
jgi:predicted component of type VI protein secretion system